MHHGQHADFSESRLRAARADEFEILCDLDTDASRLFDQVGLELTPANSLEFTAAERSRWLECLQMGTTFVASGQFGEPVGFAAVRVLDGECYLEQLSVRMNAMRNRIGTALLNAAECLAAETRTRTLWLTTYRHLPWRIRVAATRSPKEDQGPCAAQFRELSRTNHPSTHVAREFPLSPSRHRVQVPAAAARAGREIIKHTARSSYFGGPSGVKGTVKEDASVPSEISLR